MNFRTKTILGIALIETLLLALLIVSVMGYLNNSNERQLQQRATATANLLASTATDAVLSSDLATVDSLVQRVLGQPDILYVRVVGVNGVLAEGGDAALLARPFVRDEQLDAVKDGSYDTQAEIRLSGRYYARVELGVATRAIEQLLQDARHWSLGIAALEVVLVAIFSFILGTFLTRQLSQLRRASEIIAGDGPGHQLLIAGRDELAEAYQAFNAMSLSLAESQAQLRRSLDEVEQQVALAEERRALQEAMVSSSHDAVVTMDSRGRVTVWNPMAEQTFGWTREEALGRPVDELIIPEELRERHRRGLSRYLHYGCSSFLGIRLTMEGLHREGRRIPIELTITPITSGESPIFTAYMRDLTQQLSHEAELRLAAISFQSHEAVMITDAQNRIIRVNRAFSLITGYLQDEVLGQTPRVLSSGRHDPTFYRQMWRQLQRDQQWEGEIYNRRKGGEIFPEWLSITAVLDDNGQVTHYVAHFIDITEQKRQEEGLRQARADAERANKQKSRFFATLSHEIRSTLNAVISTNDLLLESDLDPHQRHLAHISAHGGQTLLGLVNGVLDMAKIEAGKLELHPDWFDLIELVEGTVSLYAAEAERKGVNLEAHFEAGVAGECLGDALRLRQILVNLIANAIKFTREGRVRVLLQHIPDALRLQVEDSGPGMSPSDQSAIFDEFVQVGERSAHARGTGLGLAIVKSLVDLMGGAIRVRSQLGQGTTFILSLPLPGRAALATARHLCAESPLPTLPAPSTRKPAPFDTVTGLAERRILVAEDSPENQAVITAVLSKQGYGVTLVENGAAAVEQAQAAHYDLILLDLTMPRMGGIEACRAIRAGAGPNAQSLIIALSATPLAEDVQACYDAGMNHFISKPFSIPQLRDEVAHWLGGGARDAPAHTANTPVDEAAPLVERAVLKQLEEETSVEIVAEILEIFTQETRKRVERMVEQHRDGQLSALMDEAHTLKGASGSFGCRRLQALALVLEGAAREADTTALAEAIATLPGLCEETLALLAHDPQQAPR